MLCTNVGPIYRCNALYQLWYQNCNTSQRLMFGGYVEGEKISVHVTLSSASMQF